MSWKADFGPLISLKATPSPELISALFQKWDGANYLRLSPSYGLFPALTPFFPCVSMTISRLSQETSSIVTSSVDLDSEALAYK